MPISYSLEHGKNPQLATAILSVLGWGQGSWDNLCVSIWDKLCSLNPAC